MLEQHKQGRTVLANAAPGVVFAEAVAARIDGKPIGVSLDGEGIKPPNRFGPFPIEHPPLDAPDGDIALLVKDLFRSAHLETGRTGEAGTMTVPEMMSVLRGFFELVEKPPRTSPLRRRQNAQGSQRSHQLREGPGPDQGGGRACDVPRVLHRPGARSWSRGACWVSCTPTVNSERKWKTP